MSRSSSSSTGWTERIDERQRDEEQRQADGDLRVGEVEPERALGPVQGQQGQAGDDRRQRERQVDQRVDGALAREIVADQDPGDERAHDRVDQHDDRARANRQLQRGQRRRIGDRGDERFEPGRRPR